MIEDILRWQELENKLSQSFSPGTAIQQLNVFYGRHAILRRVIDAVNQPGQHVAIYGERGVGKTSLANVLADSLRPLTSEEIISHKVNCGRESSFRTIWNTFFKNLGIPEKYEYQGLTPNDVFNELPKDRKIILIIDEFDRIGNPDVDTNFADTIKTLSDFRIDTTIVIVGVADDIDDLISEHESIDRCLKQVHLPRMDFNELREIIEKGIKNSGMTISEDAIVQICTISLGLPHYVHALGLAAGHSAIDSHRTNIEQDDVQRAIEDCLKDTQQTILKSFDNAVASPHHDNLYFQVLLACALAPTDYLGCFRAADIKGIFSKIMKRSYEIPAFSPHLHDLCLPKRGEVLQKLGEARNFRFRFTNPMMQPYVIMRGLEKSLVSLSEIKPLNI
jgi:Cdc6-like AAA superfamily ATPase